MLLARRRTFGLAIAALLLLACGDDATDARAHDTGTHDADAPVVDPEFELGTNLAYDATPDAFVALADGDALDVQLGFQGLHMVVLAFRQRGALSGPVELDASLSIDGEQVGTLALTGQALLPGPEGWSYYYNFFLVVPEPSAAIDRNGRVTFEAQDAHGGRVVETLDVALRRGDGA